MTKQLEIALKGGGAVKQVSLWTYNKREKSVKKLLMPHPHADGRKLSIEHSFTIPLDSIPTISRVTILSWKGEPLKLLVEGSTDFRNVTSVVVDAESDQTIICLQIEALLVLVRKMDC